MRLREDGASVDASEEVGPRIGHHSSLLASRRRRPRRARRGVARRPHPQAAARCRVRSGARERKLASSQTFFSRVKSRFPKTGDLKIRRVGLFRRLDAWWTTVSEARETATASPPASSAFQKRASASPRWRARILIFSGDKASARADRQARGARWRRRSRSAASPRRGAPRARRRAARARRGRPPAASARRGDRDSRTRRGARPPRRRAPPRARARSRWTAARRWATTTTRSPSSSSKARIRNRDGRESRRATSGMSPRPPSRSPPRISSICTRLWRLRFRSTRSTRNDKTRKQTNQLRHRTTMTRTTCRLKRECCKTRLWASTALWASAAPRARWSRRTRSIN